MTKVEVDVTATSETCPVCRYIVNDGPLDEVLCICIPHEGLHEYCTEVCEC